MVHSWPPPISPSPSNHNRKNPCRMFSLRQGFLCLLLLEAHAVGALIHGGVGLMGADLNGVQAAVGLTLAMVRAGSDLAFDGSVGGAGAAAVGMIGHEEIPPCKIRAKRTFGPRAEDSLRRGAKNIHRARTL